TADCIFEQLNNSEEPGRSRTTSGYSIGTSASSEQSNRFVRPTSVCCYPTRGEDNMKRSCLIGVIAVLFITPLRGQGQGGGNKPPEFQTKMPWRAWEYGFQTGWAGVPRAQMVVEPFKMFDNMYYIGLQNNSVLLITTSDGLMLIDTAYGDTADMVLNNIRK